MFGDPEEVAGLLQVALDLTRFSQLSSETRSRVLRYVVDFAGTVRFGGVIVGGASVFPSPFYSRDFPKGLIDESGRILSNFGKLLSEGSVLLNLTKLYELFHDYGFIISCGDSPNATKFVQVLTVLLGGSFT
ncbi:hypothetical protein GF357_04800 [Candidatus Dojkabacteria bacterium]|nr:hypothetical protein [Candidatus Dojkabacteria bacterium]